MNKRNVNNIAKAITNILIVFVVIAAIVSIVFLTNGLTSTPNNFQLKFNETKITKDIEDVVLEKGTVNKIEIINVLDELVRPEEIEAKEFEVKIIANPTCSFEFTANDILYDYIYEEDLTAFFDIQVFDTYFLLTIDKDFSLENILSQANDNAQIEIPQNIDCNDWFTIMVVSGKKSINISFSVYQEVEDVKLDRKEIIL